MLFVARLCVVLSLLTGVLSIAAEEQPAVKAVMLPGETLEVSGRPAFILWPAKEKRSTPQPWILYAPTLPAYPDSHEKWMHEKFLAAGVAVAGIDAGEAHGSPAGTKLMAALHEELTAKRGFAPRPCLLGRSRGGLHVSGFAIAHPEKVAGIAGIYPVFDLRTYPGLANAAGAYGLKPVELEAKLEELNPIARIDVLAKAKIPVCIIHGDDDKVVPLKENSATLAARYEANGAKDAVELIVAEKQGHNFWEGFFRCEKLVDFAIARAKAGVEKTDAEKKEAAEIKCADSDPPAAGLKQLEYNHPGLAVDLGVGLWAWPIPCDADGDGDFDLLVSCPDKPSNGVWFFENTTGDTAEHKFPIFKAAQKLSSTVHYVMPSYVKGTVRVLSPGIEYPDFLQAGIAGGVKLPVDPNFYKPIGKQTKGPKVRHNQWRYVDFNGDGTLDLVVGIEDWSDYGWDDAWDERGHWKNGPLHGFVLLFKNGGTNARPKYESPLKLAAGGEPIDVRGCPSPNLADFDSDGDLDLLCGEFLDGFTYFENAGTRTEPEFSAGQTLVDAAGKRLAMELEMIVPITFDWDSDGDMDLIVGDEDGRVALVDNTGKLSEKRVPLFAPPHYFQQQAETLKCGALTTPVGFDWDGDGDWDIVSGNTAGYLEFFENLSGPKVEYPEWAAPVRLKAGGKTFRVMAGPNGSIQGPVEAKWGYTCLTIADWDGDQLPDVLTNDIWGRVHWLRNVGQRTEPELAAAEPIEVQWPAETPKPKWTWWQPKGKELVTQWRTTPVAVDWNADGLMDLVMLDHEGFLAFFERAKRGDKLVLLPPRRVFHSDKEPDMQLAHAAAGGSGRRKLCIVDWNGDGKLDLLANSTSATLWRQVDAQDGQWTFADAGPLAEEDIQGHTTSPTVVDFNGDGIPDLLCGAEDGRMYYVRNPRTK